MSEGFPKLYIVWKGELKPVDKPIFSTGDSYVLDNEDTIFIWLGENSSVDEKGSAAIQAQSLDEARSGAAKVITIDQGQETDDFFATLAPLGSFRLVDKNLVGSMLVDVETASWSGRMEHVNALYRVSSEDFEGDINKMQYKQVPFEKESLDSGNAYIADLGDEILVWVGSGANVKERMMAGRWAHGFDADRAGAQPVLYYDEGDDAEFMDKCWGAGIQSSTSKFAQLKAEKVDVDEGSEEEEEETPASKPAAKPAPKPAAKPAPKPAAKPAPKPAAKPAPKPAAKPAPKPAAKPAPKPAPIEEKEAGEEESKVEVFEEKEEEEVTPEAPAPAAVEYGARWQCPKCGNNDRRMIREVQDKTILLNAYPPVYGKKLVCGKCGGEWRQK
ncbi:MAG TPA: hypothetical protein VKK79_19275 [Candidatus Lokiarchaeia archaeon]|nr:hypothetical protein [Candidatus Lokiarchaeia archaeon]